MKKFEKCTNPHCRMAGTCSHAVYEREDKGTGEIHEMDAADVAEKIDSYVADLLTAFMSMDDGQIISTRYANYRSYANYRRIS